jgi:hypothetical protein
MKKLSLSPLESFPYFTTAAVKQLAGDETCASGTLQTALYRWMKSGQIIALKKGVYMARRFYENHRADSRFALMVSAILNPQAYVSLEYILQQNGVLTEVTYPVSAVTPKQTRVIENKLGTFTYRKLKTDLYTGFTISDYLGISIAQASAAKALFDLLYLRPGVTRLISTSTSLAEALRLNLEDYPEKDRAEFAAFVEVSKSRKMDRVYKNLRKTIWRP